MRVSERLCTGCLANGEDYLLESYCQVEFRSEMNDS